MPDLVAGAPAARDARTAVPSAPAPDTEAWKDVDHDLFDRLRAVRLRIARERGVPPYVIFHDTTLRELARLKPSTRRRAADRLRHRRAQGRAAGRGVRRRDPQLRCNCERSTADARATHGSRSSDNHGRSANCDLDLAIGDPYGRSLLSYTTDSASRSWRSRMKAVSIRAVSAAASRRPLLWTPLGAQDRLKSMPGYDQYPEDVARDSRLGEARVDQRPVEGRRLVVRVHLGRQALSLRRRDEAGDRDRRRGGRRGGRAAAAAAAARRARRRAGGSSIRRSRRTRSSRRSTRIATSG